MSEKTIFDEVFESIYRRLLARNSAETDRQVRERLAQRDEYFEARMEILVAQGVKRALEMIDASMAAAIAELDASIAANRAEMEARLSAPPSGGGLTPEVFQEICEKAAARLEPIPTPKLMPQTIYRPAFHRAPDEASASESPNRPQLDDCCQEETGMQPDHRVPE